MAEPLDSTTAFEKTLAEVEILLAEADRSVDNEPKTAVMNKAAVLLLTGKFEAFLESVAEDFLFAMNSLRCHGRHVPLRLLAEHSVKAVQNLRQKLDSGNLDAVRKAFSAVSRLWSDLDPCTRLAVPCRFNYGRHGEDEIVKLFRRLGVDDLFEQVVVHETTREIYDSEEEQQVDIRGLVNSLTGLRNNILHQDASPSLTSTTIRQQSTSLKEFARELERLLQALLDATEQKVRSEGACNAG